MEKKKKELFIIFIIILVGIGIIYSIFFEETEGIEEMDSIRETENNSISENSIIAEKKTILVHIMGQVNMPGLVELEENARIQDAIEAAGGATQEADFSKINLAYILEDGMKIYIPKIGEEEAYITKDSGEATTTTNEKAEGTKELMININTASQDELERLPGIGQSTANKIINYRKENGKFTKIEDIQNVSGIGEAKFNNIKNYITVK